MATISPLHATPFHTTPFHPVGSRAFRWLLLFVWAAALSGGPLLAVGSAQDGHYDCTDGEADNMRLGAGGHAHTGNVEICHENQWRFVCDDGFGEEEAKVVCGHLNNNDMDIPALPAFTLSLETGLNPYAFSGDWGNHPGPNKWWLDDLECLGTEPSLAACEHREWGQFNCGNPERVGVYCGPPPISLSVDKTTIAEGETATVTFTVTDSTHVTSDAQTVSFYFSGSTASAEGDFKLDGRRYLGNALPLTLSANATELTATITADKDSDPEGAETITVTALYLGLTVSETITITGQKAPDIIGQEGALRLRGSDIDGQGRVEIYHAGQWGTICNSGFGEREARVACEQLGYLDYDDGYVWAWYLRPRGQATDRVWLSNLYCREDDDELVECGRGMAWGTNSCAHSSDVGVVCPGERSNQPPIPPLTISDQTHMQAEAFSYTIDAFTDPEGETLTYTVEPEDGDALPLPSWLSFNPATRTFTAAANAATATVGVRVTATDPGEDDNAATTDDNLSASVVFTILVITSDNSNRMVGRDRRQPDEHDASRVETYTLPPQDSAGSSAGSRTPARNTDSAVTWSLDRSEEFCDDADQFTIAPDATDSDRATLTFREPPDYENPADCDMNNTYEVTVRATRGSDETFTREVTVAVQDVTDVLMVVEGPAVYVENDTEEPMTLELTGVSDTVTVTWSLDSSAGAGCDADQFTINRNSGTLTFREPPDHENPTDCNMDSTYEVTVQARAGGNPFERTLTIRVIDGNDPPTFVAGQQPSIEVPENSAPYVIDTFEATDPNPGDTLTYSLRGDDEEFFTINNSGELRPAAAFDHEQPEDEDNGNTYEVVVLVSDGKDANGETDEDPDAELRVTITVTNVNEGPTFADDQASFDVPENSGSSFDIGTVAAMADPENDRLTYSLAGVDEEFFTINSGGELSPDHDAALDYEQPGDKDRNKRYEVVVLVSDHREPDGTNDADETADDRLPVTITVTDVNEAGTVSLDPPQALAPLMATLNDPDRDSRHRVTWEWEKSENDTGPWDIIDGKARPARRRSMMRAIFCGSPPATTTDFLQTRPQRQSRPGWRTRRSWGCDCRATPSLRVGRPRSRPCWPRRSAYPRWSRCMARWPSI